MHLSEQYSDQRTLSQDSLHLHLGQQIVQPDEPSYLTTDFYSIRLTSKPWTHWAYQSFSIISWSCIIII